MESLVSSLAALVAANPMVATFGVATVILTAMLLHGLGNMKNKDI